jgi:putative autotransporter adhesin-like protein
MKRSFTLLDIVVLMIAAATGIVFLYESSAFRAGVGATAQQGLPPFERVAVQGFAELILVPGTAETIAVEGDPEYLRSLRLDVTDRTLTIENPRSRHWWLGFVGGDAKPALVTVTYRTLDTVTVEGAAKVRADRLPVDRLNVLASGAAEVRIGALEARELVVNGSGALKMEVGGRTVTQKVRLSGAADYRAAKLDSETATVAVTGAGKVIVRVQKALDIAVSGAGAVEYFGDPKVTQDIRGVGSVHHRSGAD